MNKGKTPIAHQLRTLYSRKKFLETRRVNGELLKRREVEELRLSSSEIQKFKILSLCLVPVGNILIAPIFFNPRRFWPYMLWDDKNHIKYREQENLERNSYQKQLIENPSLHSLVVQSQKMLHTPPLLNALYRESFEDSSSLSLHNLPRSHLEQLAACHNLCSFSFLYSWSPTSFLVKWLTIRGHELIEDDRLLLAEEDIGGLTTKEVIDACLRRGILTKGVYATLFLDTGVEDEDGEGGGGDESMGSNEDNVLKLMRDNWDIDVLRKRLTQWVDVVDKLKLTPEQYISMYVHASALGLFVQKQ